MPGHTWPLLRSQTQRACLKKCIHKPLQEAARRARTFQCHRLTPPGNRAGLCLLSSPSSNIYRGSRTISGRPAGSQSLPFPGHTEAQVSRPGGGARLPAGQPPLSSGQSVPTGAWGLAGWTRAQGQQGLDRRLHLGLQRGREQWCECASILGGQAGASHHQGRGREQLHARVHPSLPLTCNRPN